MKSLIVNGVKVESPWQPEDGPLRLTLTDGHGTVILEQQVSVGLFNKDINSPAWNLTRQTQQLDLMNMVADAVRSMEVPTLEGRAVSEGPGRNEDARQALVEELQREYPRIEFSVINKSGTAFEGDPMVPEFVICFTHDGMCIIDPFQSECGRFEQAPSYYGLDFYDAVRMGHFNGVKGDGK